MDRDLIKGALDDEEEEEPLGAVETKLPRNGGMRSRALELVEAAVEEEEAALGPRVEGAVEERVVLWCRANKQGAQPDTQRQTEMRAQNATAQASKQRASPRQA